MQERQALEDGLGTYTKLDQDLSDNIELLELGEMEEDAETVTDAEESIKALQLVAAKKQLESLLSGEADANDCFLNVNAGSGGTEAQDWAQMILRMYSRWADQHGYKIELMEESNGEEAGIKSATIQIKGHNAFGWLKTESGVHRLVRISPFDSNARRHTSFASVWVYPVIDDTIEIEIEDKDIRIDTYRASGAGGQHINKTDSAGRLTHEPSGIVVQCQNQRSQHQNRDTCWQMLRAKLYEAEMQKRAEAAQATEDTKSDIGWGSQIRSYVLDDARIKDLRTGIETRNTGAVLDGKLDQFIVASLKAGL